MRPAKLISNTKMSKTIDCKKFNLAWLIPYGKQILVLKMFLKFIYF